MTTFPNKQNQPAGAIPVYQVQPGAVAGLTYLGYEKIASLVAATALTLPTGTVNLAVVTPEDGSVRWLSGADPTGDNGMILWGTATQQFGGDLAALRFINMTGSVSKLNVVYYGVAP